jgi:DNA-binding GntR family transcriptional regulator
MYILASHFMDDSRRATANAQHKDLLAAMRERDADRAVAVMYDHMRETFDHVGHMSLFHEQAGDTEVPEVHDRAV